MGDIDKFLENNKVNFDKLNGYIDKHKDNIRYMVASIELSNYLVLTENGRTHQGGFVTYKDIMVITNPYNPTNLIDFIHKEGNGIRFDIPCICGHYKGEEHNKLI